MTAEDRCADRSIPLAGIPASKACADERLGARKIVDQLEAPAPRRSMGDDPIADLVRAIACCSLGVGKELGEPFTVAVFEIPDAFVIEILVDPAHGRFADGMAQAAGAKNGNAQRRWKALDRAQDEPSPGKAAAHAQH